MCIRDRLTESGVIVGRRFLFASHADVVVCVCSGVCATLHMNHNHFVNADTWLCQTDFRLPVVPLYKLYFANWQHSDTISNIDRQSKSKRTKLFRATKKKKKKKKKIPHRQPGPLCESSSPLSPFESARVVGPS